jgi:hypothetical protein
MSLTHPNVTSIQNQEEKNASKVIVWDEFFSNHKQLFESAYYKLKEFQGKVIICLGDIR